MYNVYLVQPTYDANKTGSIWLPYTIAALWAYVEQFDFVKNNFKVKDLIYDRSSLHQAVVDIKDPDICLFSNYIWNWEFNNALAKKVKQKYPHCKIVFGGAQVPEWWTEPNDDYIDTIVQHEGEENCKQLLQDFLENKLKPRYNKRHRTQLETHPSPYVDGPWMDYVYKKQKGKVRAIIETNRGCPFACTFCDWGGLTKSKIKTFNIETYKKEINWIAKNKIEYIYIADANFGALFDRDLEIAKYLAQSTLHQGYPKFINVNWYKNSRQKILEINKVLSDAGLARGLNMSVQSMNPKTLKAIKRDNMEVSKLEEMYKICNNNDLPFYTEFIVGLPYETLETWTKGICKAIDLGCHYAIDVFPYEIMPNAEAYNQIEEYGMTVGRYNLLTGEVPEWSSIVTSTGTMSTEDIVEAWVWSWFIQTFHIEGITKNEYLNSNKSAFEFYTNLYKVISTDSMLSMPLEKARDRFTKAYAQLSIGANTILEIFDTEAVNYYKENFYEIIDR
jgi:radical SAM superfamily enzyme YgiQ (UPF0313 family)